MALILRPSHNMKYIIREQSHFNGMMYSTPERCTETALVPAGTCIHLKLRGNQRSRFLLPLLPLEAIISYHGAK